MATATRPQIEKIVRSILSEEQNQNNTATLAAIERVSNLLTREVIPNLPDDTDSDEHEPEADNGPRRSARAATPPDDEPDIPEEDDNAGDGIPEPVTDAFEEMYKALSPEQATALASFFGAIANGLGEGDEPDAEPDPQSA